METLPKYREYKLREVNESCALEVHAVRNRGRYTFDEARDELLRLNATKNFTGKPRTYGCVKVEPVEEFGLVDPFFTIETCCIAWFTIETMLRFITAPSRVRFFATAMNMIDLVSRAKFVILVIRGLYT